MPSELNPTFQDVTPMWKGLPIGLDTWYFTNTVSDISEEALPWMLAQGWVINGTNIDETVTPPIKTYLMARTKLLNQNVVNSLLIDFTNSFNEGRSANDKRYEDVVFAWQDVLDKYQADMDTFQADKVQDATTGYLTLMLNTVDQLDSEYSTFEADWESYDTDDRTDALTQLKTTWSAAADTSQAEYDSMVAGLDLESIIADVDGAIDDLTDAVTTFNANYDTLGTTLYADWLTHQALTRSYLTDLGATELARINEEFTNKLAVQTQSLTDRGFYTSAIITDITVRNARERDDQIQTLNDRLNREHVDNEHKLYEQQYRMRLGGLEASVRAIDASAKVVASRLSHGQWASEVRHRVASLSVESRMKLLSFREKYYQMLLQSISWESDRRAQLYDKLVQVRLRQFELRGRVCDKDFELLKYQLDERSNIAASLFGFIERRTDAYPDLNAMGQLATNLGETGASTWQSA